MRAKRSKDARLVDKFSKQRQDLGTEGHVHQAVNSSVNYNDSAIAMDNEEDDLKVETTQMRSQLLKGHGWLLIHINFAVAYVLKIVVTSTLDVHQLECSLNVT